MTINEQIKILDNKIRPNQAQYDLDRQNAKISALSSDELDKYEYLTGEDLEYKPDVVETAKFEYSPLSQVFNKGLEKDEKNEGLLKRLKNIEDKTDNQLKENKDSQLGIKSIGYTGGNNKDYDFTNFSSYRDLFRAIYYGEILIPAVQREQDNFDDMIKILKAYRPRKDSKYYGLKQDLANNVQNFYNGREMIIEAFKNKFFPFYSGNYYKELEEESSEGKNEASSESEDKIPDISTSEQITMLDTFYSPLFNR